METSLKKKDSILYLLSQGYGDDVCKAIKKYISSYKLNDDILTELVKELRNKIVNDLERDTFDNKTIENSFELIKNVSDRINDLSSIANSLMECKEPLDLLILLEILNIRLDKFERTKTTTESIPPIVIKMATKAPSKAIIEKQLLPNDIQITKFTVSNQLDKLVRLLISTNDQSVVDIIKNILYSPRINELSLNSITKAVDLIEPALGISDKVIMEELVHEYIKDTSLLLGFKEYLINSNDKELKIKYEVANIYRELYTNYYGINNAARRKLVANPKAILEKYDDETLQAFVTSLDGSYIHKKAWEHQLDLINFFLLLNKPSLAMQMFEKSCYKPINKEQRKRALYKNFSDFVREDFSIKLNNAIDTCLKTAHYEPLFRILSHKKVDSLSISRIYNILRYTTHQRSENSNYKSDFCTPETRAKIVEVLKQKINDEGLLVYRTSKNWYDKDEGFVYDKAKAIDYIDYIETHPDEFLADVIKEFAGIQKVKK